MPVLIVLHLWTSALWQQTVKELPRFEQYSVIEIFHGPPVAVDITSTKLARAYRTQLSEGAKKGPNFAGHFTLVSWGCGASCQTWAIVDARTGKVFESTAQSTAGAEFYPNSRLLILDSPKAVRDTLGGPPPADCSYCGTPDAFEWTGAEWRAVAGADIRRIHK